MPSKGNERNLTKREENVVKRLSEDDLDGSNVNGWDMEGGIKAVRERTNPYIIRTKA